MADTTMQVTAPDGVRLAVRVSGDPAGPCVLLVHGFPDDHRVWDGVAARLEPTHRVVRLDTRGSGASDRPRAVSAYRLPHLADDLEAVLAAVAGDGPVHLVGHDWGSVQGWHLVTTTRRPIASFTSISGPCLDHLPAWAGRRLREGPRGWRALLAMWKSPIYMTAFQVPVLAPLACRLGAVDALIRTCGRFEGTPRPTAARSGARMNADALKIYTANLVPRLLRPARRGTTVPVQVLAPRTDIFVPAVTQGEVDPWVRTARTVDVDGGHWVPVHHPAPVADLVAAWIVESTSKPIAPP